MRKNEFQFALDNLETGNPVLIATIIRQAGSSPRGKGSRFVLNEQGHSVGSIGGGMLEETVKRSYESSIATKNVKLMEFTLSEDEAESLEMICGGTVTVLVEPVLPEDGDMIGLIRKVVEFHQLQKPAWQITQVPAEGETISLSKCLLSADGDLYGNLIPKFLIQDNQLREISFENGPNQKNILPSGTRTIQEIKSGQSVYVVEPIGQVSRAIIFGAGHISQKLAPLCKMVGFYTVVLDNRPQYVTVERFPEADDRIQLSDFLDVFQNITVDRDSYIVIATSGHSTDKMVLGQALASPAGYVGMIGSRRKIELTFEALRAEGVSDALLTSVHTPVGVRIGAETPEEIAISIVAELIQERKKARLG